MSEPSRREYDIVSTLAYVGLHLVCLTAFWLGDVQKGLVICLVSYVVRMWLLGTGYHRYFAHRSFRTSRWFQLVLAVGGVLSFQRGPLWWASTHRTHHKHADTTDDLHSPHHEGFLYSHSGWFLDKRHRTTDYDVVWDFAKYPELRFLDRNVVQLAIVGLFTLTVWMFLGVHGVIWGVCISTVLLLHATHWVQSVSHSMGGYRIFDTKDDSRNHWLFAIIALGEFHNNHHYAPYSSRMGYRWWEFDFNHLMLRVLHRLGFVWDLKTFPEQAARHELSG